MLPLRILARVIGVSQLVLGLALLFFADLFFSTFGFSPASGDQKYLFGQLAARFLAYGLGMFFIARDLDRNWFWWDLMIAIQALDFGVGLWYSLWGGVAWTVSWFPLMNAGAFTLLLLWGRLSRRRREGRGSGCPS